MALGWLTVLQAVPWSDVIANAPKVADGAKKLWNTVAKKPEPAVTAAPATTNSVAQASPHEQALATLGARVLALEASTAQIHEQLLASSELIKALAEQNTQLIQRIESNRVRVVRLTWLASIGAAAGLVGLGLAWSSS